MLAKMKQVMLLDL